MIAARLFRWWPHRDSDKVVDGVLKQREARNAMRNARGRADRQGPGPTLPGSTDFGGGL